MVVILLASNAVVSAAVISFLAKVIFAVVLAVVICEVGITLFDAGINTSNFFVTADVVDTSLVAYCCISHPFISDDDDDVVVVGSVVLMEGILGIATSSDEDCSSMIHASHFPSKASLIF